MKIVYLSPLEGAPSTDCEPPPAGSFSAAQEDLIAALVKSGFSHRTAEAALRTALGPAEELIRPSLSAMAFVKCGAETHMVSRGKRFSGFTFATDNQKIWGVFDPNSTEPVQLDAVVWVFRRKCYRLKYRVGEARPESPDEIALLIKHAAYKQEKALERIQKEVAAFENFERLPSARRERIPESVRLFVWQRDSGRYVQCGSNERLEFDHIIPVAEGGSSTERNVQLLCETCNRKKGKTV
jgi:5-methylcytosine-specific restriction endonuclease McrA